MPHLPHLPNHVAQPAPEGVQAISRWLIRVRPHRCQLWYWHGLGGATPVRAHAHLYPDKSAAEAALDRLERSHPGWQFQVQRESPSC